MITCASGLSSSHSSKHIKTHFGKILHKFTQIFLFNIQQRTMSSSKNHEEEDRNIDVPRGSYPSILEGKTLLKMSDIEWETIYVTPPSPSPLPPPLSSFQTPPYVRMKPDDKLNHLSHLISNTTHFTETLSRGHPHPPSRTPYYHQQGHSLW